MNYLSWVEEQQHEQLLNDVYITDNKPKAPRYNVNNEKELDVFMNYEANLQAHNEGLNTVPKAVKRIGKYRKGSLAQKIFEPLIEAERDENGTYNLQVEECEINRIDEESLRTAWENAKKTNEVHEGEPDDEEWNIQLMQDLEAENISLDKWN